MDSVEYKIYVLVNPLDGSLFYVGQTNQPILERFKCHCYSFSNHKSPTSLKDIVIKKILHAKEIPLVKILEVVYARKDSLLRERFWMEKLKKEGHPITNKEVNQQRKYEVIYTEDFIYGISIEKTNTMKKNCTQCGKEFEGNRKSLFCTDECKKLKGKIPTIAVVAKANDKKSAREFIEEKTGFKVIGLRDRDVIKDKIPEIKPEGKQSGGIIIQNNPKPNPPQLFFRKPFMNDAIRKKLGLKD